MRVSITWNLCETKAALRSHIDLNLALMNAETRVRALMVEMQGNRQVYSVARGSYPLTRRLRWLSRRLFLVHFVPNVLFREPL
jgi:radical SAM superfamily enzyme with C-terminal helix-hairpin-helix motif